MDFKTFINGALGRPEKGDTVKTFGLRNRVSGYILTKAQQNVPTCGYNYEADLTKFWEEFQSFKKECGYAPSDVRKTNRNDGKHEYNF